MGPVAGNDLLLVELHGETVAKPRNTSSPTIERSPSPLKDLKGIHLFRRISHQIAKKSKNNDKQLETDSDSTSSNTDSYDSPESRKKESFLRSKVSNSMDNMRRAFKELSLAVSKSETYLASSSASKEGRSAKKSPPKKILRSPVTYTYVKGMSGLPTRRIRRNRTHSDTHRPCCCSLQFTHPNYQR